jgi:AbrB family looped-hinge helix DNA binding protein
METVVVSSKYQVVIPRSVREEVGLQAGQRVRVIPFRDRIEVIPLRPAQVLRGFLRGVDPRLPRRDARL